MPPTPPPYAPALQRGVFGTKIPSSVTFAIAVLLFLLPFIDIRCNNMSLMKVSGVELATGFHIKSPGQENTLIGQFDNLNTDTKKENKGEKKDANIWAMAALGLGILGFILSLLNAKAGGIGGLVTGILSAASMVGLYIDIKHDASLENGTKAVSNDPLGLESMGRQMAEGTIISVDFTPWFYVAVIAFLVAAFFSYKRIRAK